MLTAMNKMKNGLLENRVRNKRIEPFVNNLSMKINDNAYFNDVSYLRDTKHRFSLYNCSFY